MSPARQPACFLGHGVPALLAGEADATHAWMRRFGAVLRAGSPNGIVCVSAHFVASSFTVTTSEAPVLLTDPESAGLVPSGHRPAGSLSLARRVVEHLLPAGLKATADPARGLDHGAWLPLSLMFPEGDVPIVQLSIHASLDPEIHFAVGRAIEPLRDDGVVIIGSGGLTHDVADRDRIAKEPAAPDVLSERSRRFQAWATDLLIGSAPYTRARGLTRFRDHPDAHVVHGTGEHMLPLLVVAGAASKDVSPGNVAAQVHAGCQRGLSTAAFCFGG